MPEVDNHSTISVATSAIARIFCKPYDFVLAPIIRKSRLDAEIQAEKPILITRFTKHANEWSTATYYNVRTGEECRVTTRESNDPKIIPVRSYREILHQYLCNPESKFKGPDGKPCDSWTRGILQRRHVVAGTFVYCGKEFKRKLEQGPADHETDFKVKVYASGRVSADPDVLRALGEFSEREINRRTGLSRRIIRSIRHGGRVKHNTLQRITDFLRNNANANGPGHTLERSETNAFSRMQNVSGSGNANIVRDETDNAE